jgi:hypothetical protein
LAALERRYFRRIEAVPPRKVKAQLAIPMG